MDHLMIDKKGLEEIATMAQAAQLAASGDTFAPWRVQVLCDLLVDCSRALLAVSGSMVAPQWLIEVVRIPSDLSTTRRFLAAHGGFTNNPCAALAFPTEDHARERLGAWDSDVYRLVRLDSFVRAVRPANQRRRHGDEAR